MLKVNCLEEFHVGETVVLVLGNELTLHALNVIFLLFQDSEFVIETFPLRFIHLFDIVETTGNVFDHCVELFDIDLQDYASLANTFGAIRVSTDPGNIFQS